MNTEPEGMTILVADDSTLYRKLVEQSLSQEECTLLFPKDGRQFSIRLRSTTPKW
jgi:CheY-like chemotaxis protein